MALLPGRPRLSRLFFFVLFASLHAFAGAQESIPILPLRQFVEPPPAASASKLAVSGRMSFLAMEKAGAKKAQGDRSGKHPKPSLFYQGMELNYLMLNTLDLVTTFYGLEHGAREANPIASKFIGNRPATVLVKSGLTLATLWSLRLVRKENRKAATVGLAVLNVFYGVVVANNIRVVAALGH